MLNVRIKKLHPNAVIPSYAKPGDAGLDLTAVTKKYDDSGNVVYTIGLAFEIPEGYVGLLFPRSSNAKKDLLLSNSVGVIDSGYRGDIGFKFKPSACFMDFETKDEIERAKSSDFIDFPAVSKDHNAFNNPMIEEYEIGDRIGQIIILPYPKIKFELVDELSDTERGDGGFGSTGTK